MNYSIITEKYLRNVDCVPCGSTSAKFRENTIKLERDKFNVVNSHMLFLLHIISTRTLCRRFKNLTTFTVGTTRNPFASFSFRPTHIH